MSDFAEAVLSSLGFPKPEEPKQETAAPTYDVWMPTSPDEQPPF